MKEILHDVFLVATPFSHDIDGWESKCMDTSFVSQDLLQKSSFSSKRFVINKGMKRYELSNTINTNYSIGMYVMMGWIDGMY